MLPRPTTVHRRALRATAITAHITAVGAWLGTDIAVIALTLVHTPTPKALSGCATVAAGITIGTGVALARRRPWGGRRYQWITVKVQIVAVVTAAGFTSLAGWFDPTTLLTARVCTLIALVVAIAVSVTKPWGSSAHAQRTPNAAFPGN